VICFLFFRPSTTPDRGWSSGLRRYCLTPSHDWRTRCVCPLQADSICRSHGLACVCVLGGMRDLEERVFPRTFSSGRETASRGRPPDSLMHNDGFRIRIGSLRTNTNAKLSGIASKSIYTKEGWASSLLMIGWRPHPDWLHRNRNR
jgi:hypothetical protein